MLPAGAKDAMHANAYFWGAQGPDFFFCHRFLPTMRGESLRGYGHALHEAKPSVVLNAMRDFLSAHDSPLYRSYIMGFVNHYTLDSTAHPYVNALVRELLEDRPKENETSLHTEIESALDTILLRKESGKVPTEIRMGKFFPKDMPVQLAIGRIYHHVLAAVFGDDIPEAAVVAATKDAHFIFSLLTDRTTLKQKFFSRIEKGKPHYISARFLPLMERDDVDYANTVHAPWHGEDGVHYTDFFEMLEEAAERSVALITQFADCDFSEITQERSFTGRGL